MDSGTPLSNPHARPAGWCAVLLGVLVATWLVGPLAPAVLWVVVAVALIGTGVRSSGWRRPALIATGVVLLLVPVLVWFEVAGGTSRVIIG